MPLVQATARDVNAYDLASQYLNALGWPNTPNNQRALAAWFMSESARRGTSVHVVGNNPLNITTSADKPYRLVGSHRIAVYSTPQQGVAAFSGLIHIKGHNYPGIVEGFKKGNGIAAVAGIINSGWVPGGNGPSYWHTVNHVRRNLLQDIYNGLPGGGSSSVMPPAGKTVSTEPSLADWQARLKSIGLPTDPNHVFTHDEAVAIVEKLYKVPHQPDNSLYKELVASFEGKTVADAKKGISGPNPLDIAGGVAGIPGAIADGVRTFLGAIIPVSAMIAGGVMSLFGIYLITKEATQGSTAESLISPVPVFIKEKI